MEVFFPRSTKNKWRFPWSVTEIPVGAADGRARAHGGQRRGGSFLGRAVDRAAHHRRRTRFSPIRATPQWTEALLPIASGADLFVVECYDYDRDLTAHMNWTTIKQRLPDFNARRVMLTHMNPTMLAKVDEAKAAGVLVAEDGLVLDL